MQLKACEEAGPQEDTPLPTTPALGKAGEGRSLCGVKNKGRVINHREEGSNGVGGCWGWGTHFLELLDLGLFKHRKDIGRAPLSLLGGCGLAPGPCLSAGLQHHKREGSSP
jgi:hypothetical protein